MVFYATIYYNNASFTLLKQLELERKVVRRTAFLAQGSIPNASEVMVRGRTDTIVKASSHSPAGKLMS